MQVVINISKTHTKIIAALSLLIIVGIAANYASAASGLSQWHPLSEISADGGATSIESTIAHGKINASYIDGIVPGDSSPWATSGNKIYNTTSSVGIGTAMPQERLDVNGSIRIGTTSSACDATHRGSMKFISSGAGANDILFVCMKKNTEEYVWNSVFDVPFIYTDYTLKNTYWNDNAWHDLSTPGKDGSVLRPPIKIFGSSTGSTIKAEIGSAGDAGRSVSLGYTINGGTLVPMGTVNTGSFAVLAVSAGALNMNDVVQFWGRTDSGAGWFQIQNTEVSSK